MSIQSPELQGQIAIWRQKALSGTLTLDEAKEAIKALRQGRHAAMTAVEKGKKSSGSKAPARNADELLGELGL